MKNFKTKIILMAVLTLSTMSLVHAQNYCEEWITPDIEEIEQSIAALKNSGASEIDAKANKDVDRAISQVESKIKSCAMRSRVPVESLTERLKKAKDSYLRLKGETPAVEQNTAIDFTKKHGLIYKMQQCADRYGQRCMKEEDKTLTRAEMEVLENYKDDGSAYYKRNIIIGQNYLENLEKNINKEKWVTTSKKYIDNKAKSINTELRLEYMNCFYSDLKYIKEVALPNNENLQTIIDYLKPHL